MMTVHVLHAGDGYTYLTRQVASHDVARSGADSLADYYTAEGSPPGVWRGSGIAGLGVWGHVSEAQMRALFGEGLHPDADAIIAERIAGGASSGEAVKAARLGRRFPRYSSDSADEWRRLVDEETSQTARKLGVGVDELTPEQRDGVRLRVGRRLFRFERGRDPVDTGELRRFVSRKSKSTPQPVAGYDLVFTPVKSVSVLWGLGDDDTRQIVEEAHDAAVGRALEFLEAEAAFTRTGTAGVAQIETQGLVVAAFDHRDNRGGDPNLHTHCAVSNRVQAADGKWRTVDGRAIHQAGVAASETYNTAIEDELRARLGVSFVDVYRQSERQPVREVAGVDARLIETFSSRREAISGRYEDLLAEYRVKYGKQAPQQVQYQLAQQATLETREAKTVLRSLADLRGQWRARAVAVVGEHGVDRLADRVMGRGPDGGPARGVAGVDVAAVAADVVARVSAGRCRWRATHVRAEAQRQLRQVAACTPDERGWLVDQVTEAAQAACVDISPPDIEETPEELQRADGVSVFRQHNGAWLTSVGVIDAETRLLDAANQACRVPVDVHVVDAAMGAYEHRMGVRLDAGQRALIRQFASSPTRVSVGIGPAGSGKTAAMTVLADTVSGAGRQVIALAPSASAAAVLGEQIGADTSETIAAVLARAADDEASAGMGAGDVVLVDEASMASTFDLDALVQIAGRQGAVVRLLGDPMQLTAVQAGGAFRLLAQATDAVQLSELHRFSDPAEAEASGGLRAGDETALDFYETHERLHAGDRDELLDDLYAAWRADIGAGWDALMVTPQTSTVGELNDRARMDRVAAGLVDSDGVRLHDGSLAGVGDVIVTRCNERRLAIGGSDFVKNGDRWTIDVRHRDGSVRARGHRHGVRVWLPAAYVVAHVELGYAITAHRAQGATVDRSHTLVDETVSREALYVAMTRGRHANHAYTCTEPKVDPEQHEPPEVPRTSRDVLAGVLAYSAADQSAHETLGQAFEQADSLARLVPEYQYGLDVRADGTMADIVHQVFDTPDSDEATGATGLVEAPVLDPRLVSAVDAAYAFYIGQREDSWVPAYLQARGLEVTDGFGYAPDGWTSLVDHLRAHGFSDDELIGAGLAKCGARGRVYDRFRDRLIQPIYDPGGTLVGFSGRANPAEVNPRTPKYMNSPAGSMYQKNAVLFGLADNHDALAAGATPVIAEGPLDAAAITHAAGGHAVGLAPGGTALTDTQIAALSQVCDLASRPVIVATDTDEAGHGAAEAAWHKLTDAGATIIGRAAFGSTASDPAALLRAAGPAALADAITLDNTDALVEHVIDRRLGVWDRVLDHINGRLGALDDVAAIVARLPDNQQTDYMLKTARRLDVDAGAAAASLAEATHTLRADTHDRGATDAEQIVSDPAWLALSSRLSGLQAAGHDPAHALRAAAEQGEFTGAESRARVLAARLDRHTQPTEHGGMIPQAPAQPADGDRLGVWLADRHTRIRARANELTRHIDEDPPAWVHAIYNPGDLDDQHRAVLADVAIYRDRYQITDPYRPIGYEPDHAGDQQRVWRRLHERLQTLPPRTNTETVHTPERHEGLETIRARLADRRQTMQQPRSRSQPDRQQPSRRREEPRRGPDLDR